MHRSTLFALLSGLIIAASFYIVWSSYPASFGAGEREESTSGALQALDFWNRSRAYPAQDIPANAYFKAYALAKQKDRHLPRTMTAGAVWDPIGPTNLHGRTRCVAVNPRNRFTIYAGTASGGLWVSHSMGLGGDWQQVKLGFPALGISSVLINPVDTNIIYLGTGEIYGYQRSSGGLVIRTTRGSYGIGILKSTDGGATWTKSLDWTYQQQRGIDMLRFNPRNPHTIWAATSEGLYRSQDDGTTWLVVAPTNLAKDVVVNPVDTSIVVASFGDFASDGSGVYASPNNGDTWSATNIPAFSGKARLCLYEANPQIVYASVADSTTGDGGLWASFDGGFNWSQVSNQSTNPIFQVQGWYSHYVIVHPTDSSKIIHNSVNRSKSTNGGSTFTNISSGYSDNHGYALDPVDPNIVYAVCDDGIYRSTDFGSSYTNIGDGMQTGQLYNGFSCSQTDSLVAIGQSQDHIPGYQYYGGSDWNHNSVSDESGWTAIDPVNDNYMYCLNRYGGTFIRSTNRGANWSGVANFGGIGAWNSPIIVAPSNPSVLYAGDTRVRRSGNRGSTWTITNGGAALDGNPTLSMSVSASNSDTVYVGTAPQVTQMHIYRTTNGGTAWTDITNGLPNRYPMDVITDPTDSKTVYVAMGGFGSGHLFKTTNAGSSWNDITGTLPDVPTTAVAVDPLYPNQVYVGNDLGVYVSTDGGSTWANFNEGLPDAVIAADLVVSRSNHALRVATHGNGVWERKLLSALPASYTDFAATVLNYPAAGFADTIGITFNPVRASFRNLSVPGQNSVDLKYRIIKNGTEVYSSTMLGETIPPGQTKIVSFPAPFTPTQTGTYYVEAIVLGTDGNTANDTLRGTINILEVPTVYLFSVAKVHRAYVDISGGTAGPAGDDAQKRIALPFAFRYDGYTYDSAQISTNGWMEFGTGTRGSYHGLSTDNQLTGYFVQAIGTTDRPNKVLAPWWTDMATYTGNISYATAGSTPNRVFTVQWQNVLAYYDPGSTSVTLNFQIKLYEGTNLIEFCYGPKADGTFGGVGASMGMKDYVGGDNRIYDLSSMNVALAGSVRSDLFPVTDWPGQDSVYIVNTNRSAVDIAVKTGWNLVSLPLAFPDRSIASAFPGYIAGTGYEYSGSYQRIDTLEFGQGCWIKVTASDTFAVKGDSLASTIASVRKGWNIIGSVDHPVTAPSGGIVASQVFGYSGDGYLPATTLEPGKGYWMKASASGSVTLGAGAAPKPVLELVTPMCAIGISDAKGRTQKLMLAKDLPRGVTPEMLELPPSPPQGAFDARFGSQLMVQPYTMDGQSFPILIASAEYPVTFTFTAGKSADTFVLEEQSGGRVIRTHAICGNTTVTLGQPAHLRIRPVLGGTIPAAFALQQNYPNPFNPSTTIRFDVPSRTHVAMSLYDILGKELRHLVNGDYDGGSYSIDVDLNGLASGIYFYRISAGTFNEVRKMVLAR